MLVYSCDMKLFSSNDRKLKKYVQACVSELSKKQELNIAQYGMGSGVGDWNMDLKKGFISFAMPDRTVVADVEAVGTFNEENGTFMWAWDHVLIPVELSGDAQLAKKWGQDKDLKKYTHNKVECDIEEAWAFTAVTCMLGEADGAYMANNGTPVIPFVTLKNIRIT